MRYGDIQDLSVKQSDKRRHADFRQTEILLDEHRERTAEENWKKINGRDLYNEHA